MSGATEKVMVQVCPGLYVHREEMSSALERKLGRMPKGSKVLLDDAGYAMLGLKPQCLKTLKRLAMCGHITLSAFGPKSYLLDVDSWVAHLKATSEDPWFWDDAARMKAYRATYEGGSWR
jgi:hypothetical protein